MLNYKNIVSIATIFASTLLSPNVLWAQETEDILQLRQNIQKACPKPWEGHFSDIVLKPDVLDIWQGDLSDKAQFVQYANQFLLDQKGNLLIDSYSDVITIITECSAQRLTYYKTIRQQIGTAVGDMVSEFTTQAAFNDVDITSGIDYTNWVDGSAPEPDGEFQQREPINLAIGRGTSQSGTTSEELVNADPDTEYTEEEYGDMAENSGYAVKAVDNNLDGRLEKGSVTYTGIQDQPFWQVDLDDLSQIDEIIIYNRTDACCSARLTNFKVLISRKPIDKRMLDDAVALDGVTTVTTSSPFESGLQSSSTQVSGATTLFTVITPPPNTKGRYVRIQLAGNETVLSLAEVVIMGRVIKYQM